MFTLKEIAFDCPLTYLLPHHVALAKEDALLGGSRAAGS